MRVRYLAHKNMDVNALAWTEQRLDAAIAGAVRRGRQSFAGLMQRLVRQGEKEEKRTATLRATA